MPNFEVHPLRTHQELQLSRQLVETMIQEQEQWGRIYPRLVEQQLDTIQRFYNTQLQEDNT